MSSFGQTIARKHISTRVRTHSDYVHLYGGHVLLEYRAPTFWFVFDSHIKRKNI